MIFWCFSKFAEKAAAHESIVNSYEIVIEWLRKEAKFDRKSVQKLDRKLRLKSDVFLKVLGVIFRRFLRASGRPNISILQTLLEGDSDNPKYQVFLME